MIDGNYDVTTVLKNLGEKYTSMVKKTIKDAKTWAVPNATSTIAMKGSSSPLIDTGRMVNAVSYEIVGAGGNTQAASAKGSGARLAASIVRNI